MNLSAYFFLHFLITNLKKETSAKMQLKMDMPSAPSQKQLQPNNNQLSQSSLVIQNYHSQLNHHIPQQKYNFQGLKFEEEMSFLYDANLKCTSESQKDEIKLLQRYLIEGFIKMNQTGQLKQNQRELVNKTIHTYLQSFSDISQVPQFLVQEKKIKCEDQASSLIRIEDDKCQYLLINDNIFSKIKQAGQQQQWFRCQTQKQSRISMQAHDYFFGYLDDSMKKLNLYHEIRKVCAKNQAWQCVRTIKTFLMRLISLKVFFPIYFSDIAKQFIAMIKQFNQIEAINKCQRYAKQLLIPQYLKCIKIFLESDDILAAAQSVYKYSRNIYRYKKISFFSDYLMKMRERAMELKRAQENNNQYNSKLKLQIKNQKTKAQFEFMQQKTKRGRNQKKKKSKSKDTIQIKRIEINKLLNNNSLNQAESLRFELDQKRGMEGNELLNLKDVRKKKFEKKSIQGIVVDELLDSNSISQFKIKIIEQKRINIKYELNKFIVN